jgi:predicted metallopeptidase
MKLTELELNNISKLINSNNGDNIKLGVILALGLKVPMTKISQLADFTRSYYLAWWNNNVDAPTSIYCIKGIFSEVLDVNYMECIDSINNCEERLKKLFMKYIKRIKDEINSGRT